MAPLSPMIVADREPSMSASRFKFTLGRSMLVIAVIAILLALLRTLFAPVLVFWVLPAFGVVALTLAVARVTGMPRFRAAACVCTGYPWLMLLALHATWLGLHVLLGDPQSSPGSHPPAINAVVSLAIVLLVCSVLLLPVVMVAGPVLIYAEAVLTVERNNPGRADEVSRLILVHVTLWLAAFLLLWLDPVQAFGWFGRLLD